MHLLAGHVGVWTGTNRFRLMPDDPPAEAEATAQLTLGAGGNLAVLAYTWTHPDDGPQDGVLVLGPADDTYESDASPGPTGGGVLALWGDSWHQQPAARTLHGTAGGGSLTVGYSYAEGWWWRIVLTAEEPDVLRWRMDNEVPASASETGEAATYWAMEGELRR
jgi:hypothetical protein